MKASISNLKDTKLVFLQTGTCSQSLFHILDQEFDNEMDLEERAAATLAGGVVYQGKVCGIVLGAILGAGVEAYHEGGSLDTSICLSIEATQKLLVSFNAMAHAINCYDIAHVDFNSKASVFRYVITRKGVKCFNLADKWAPKAIGIVREVMRQEEKVIPTCRSCATRVVLEMGGNETEASIVAGFAGGIGLSGNVCGALTAALWYKTLKWLRKHPEIKKYPDHKAQESITKFLTLTNGEYLCPSLSGKRFSTLKEHTDFILGGGCNRLIDILAKI